MEIREFAQRVLLANTLAEKLQQPPGPLTDEAPAGVLEVPGLPGRPPGLQFSARGERARLPRLDELHQPEARAVLLHAFANHELLAVELMALALLKFPGAPSAFRRGLLHTLCEEQEHTRLYMACMAEGGLQLGDLPVNGFFWKSISAMATPLDYVSHLSLTFEQANLDYARYYSQLFHRIGDTETGGLLDRIYQDEIAHVGYGLTWFRRWKDPAQADWEAWQDTMAFPLSPARAKGNVPFNREGRRQAGFSEEFVSALELFSHSKGRTPWVGWFNPAAEACALTRDAATAGADPATAALARDLELLPCFSLHAEDVVLVKRAPAVDHLRSLREAGVALPQWELLTSSGRIAEDSPLRQRKLGRLRPWAWSADAAEVLGDLVENAGEAAVAHLPWDEAQRSLYAKTTAAMLARHLAADQNFPEETWGLPATTEAEVTGLLQRLAAQGWERACLKLPWSMAGRGLIQVQTSGLTERDRTWLRALLHQQGAVVVEAWMERVADFSCQYELTPGSPPRLIGQVHLRNDAGGRFLACETGPVFTRLLPPGAARALHEVRAESLYEAVLPSLLRGLPGMDRLYGNLGVDAFLYRDPAGRIRLRPLVEINPRTTMGRVTLDLRRLTDPAKTLRFRIVHRRALQARGYSSLKAYADHLRAFDPPVRGETSAGSRLVKGTLVLNDAAVAEAFLGVLQVDPPPFG